MKNFLLIELLSLAKKNKDLKRSIKFDDENMDLFADFQLKEGARWKRITPEQAKAANVPEEEDSASASGPVYVSAANLSELLKSASSPPSSSESDP